MRSLVAVTSLTMESCFLMTSALFAHKFLQVGMHYSLQMHVAAMAAFWGEATELVQVLVLIL